MKITKIGHCCLLIEDNGKRLLLDPGSFTLQDHVLDDIDVIVITHEHGDHLQSESLQELMVKNPDVTLVTNSGAGKHLNEAGIAYITLEGTDSAEIAGFHIEAHDAPHLEVFKDMADCHNTGYFINDRFFYPGDAYTNPGKPVEVLAFPVAGPFCKLSEAVGYVLEVHPQKAFPVHDGLLNDSGVAIHHRIVTGALENSSTEFVALKNGESLEL